MKNENYLLTLQKIIPLWYEDVQTSINLAEYSNSIYFIQIKTDNGIIYRKMISQ